MIDISFMIALGARRGLTRSWGDSGEDKDKFPTILSFLTCKKGVMMVIMLMLSILSGLRIKVLVCENELHCYTIPEKSTFFLLQRLTNELRENRWRDGLFRRVLGVMPRDNSASAARGWIWMLGGHGSGVSM